MSLEVSHNVAFRFGFQFNDFGYWLQGSEFDFCTVCTNIHRYIPKMMSVCAHFAHISRYMLVYYRNVHNDILASLLVCPSVDSLSQWSRFPYLSVCLPTLYSISFFGRTSPVSAVPFHFVPFLLSCLLIRFIQFPIDNLQFYRRIQLGYCVRSNQLSIGYLYFF